MARPSKWSEEQQRRALETYQQEGACEAARRHQIPQSTISGWARESGVRSRASDKALEMMAARRADLGLQVAELRQELVDAAQLMLAAALAPWGSQSELPASRESSAITKDLMVAVAIVIDKIAVLSGTVGERQTEPPPSHQIRARSLERARDLEADLQSNTIHVKVAAGEN